MTTLTHVSIREAQQADLPHLTALLEQNDMVTEGLLAPGTRCWLVETTSENSTPELVGLAGLEYSDSAALIRSVLVRKDFRGQGIGAALVDCVLESARQAGYRQVYCFSTDAIDYWNHAGFTRVEVAELVSVLPLAPQVLHFERIGWLPTEVAWRKAL